MCSGIALLLTCSLHGILFRFMLAATKVGVPFVV